MIGQYSLANVVAAVQESESSSELSQDETSFTTSYTAVQDAVNLALHHVQDLHAMQ